MRTTMAVLGTLLLAGCASKSVDTKVVKEDLADINGWKCSATVVSGVRLDFNEHVIYRENGDFDKESRIDIKVPGKSEAYQLLITSEGQWSYADNILKEYLDDYTLEPSDNIAEDELEILRQELELPEVGMFRVFKTSENSITKRTRLSQTVKCEKAVY